MECREWPGTLLCCVANNGDGDWRTMEKRNTSEEGEKEQVATSEKRRQGQDNARRNAVREEERRAARNWQFAL